MNTKPQGSALAWCLSLALCGCAGGPAKAPEGQSRAEPSPAKPLSVSTEEPDPDRTRYEQAVREAEAARLRAASVGGEWRDIRQILMRASRAAEARDYLRALKLTEIAKEQAELGYRQMMLQQNVGNPSYLQD